MLTLHRMTIEFDSFFLWNMNICCASEDSKVLEVWFLAVPCFVWGKIIESHRGAEIFEIDNGYRDFIPDFPWELSIIDNRTNSTHNGAVCAFNNTVLIRMVRCCDFMLDSFLLEICVDESFVF